MSRCVVVSPPSYLLYRQRWTWRWESSSPSMLNSCWARPPGAWSASIYYITMPKRCCCERCISCRRPVLRCVTPPPTTHWYLSSPPRRQSPPRRRHRDQARREVVVVKMGRHRRCDPPRQQPRPPRQPIVYPASSRSRVLTKSRRAATLPTMTMKVALVVVVLVTSIVTCIVMADAHYNTRSRLPHLAVSRWLVTLSSPPPHRRRRPLRERPAPARVLR